MSKHFKLRVRGQEGFSLVELMIVVAIIGILAALAVPKFQIFQAKAKQAEAKNNLSHIYTLQMSYYGDHDVYGASIAAIGFTPLGNQRYGYTATATPANLGTATATVDILSGCTAKDAWNIDDSKNITPTHDCTAE